MKGNVVQDRDEWFQNVQASISASRHEEETILYEMFLESLQRPTSFLLIQGPRGSGRTMLARTLQKHVKHGLFLSGKYDFLQRPEPYTALVAALDEFVRLILKRGNDAVAAMRDHIHSKVGPEAAVLTRMVPSFAEILGHGSNDT